MVSNSSGNVASDDALLTVRLSPSIISPPVDKTVTAGDRARFTVGATGAGPLHYQWRKNGQDITGANRSYYTTPSTSIEDNGLVYSVVVTNNVGSVTSSGAILTVQ